jgi:flagellar biosynthesis GTPase FlhF
LVEHVSPDEYARNKNYYDRCFDYRQNLLASNNHREMECMYISGPSGVGKTTFAKMAAKSKDYACYISS